MSPGLLELLVVFGLVIALAALELRGLRRERHRKPAPTPRVEASEHDPARGPQP